MPDKIPLVDWLDYFADITVQYGYDRELCGDTLLEQIDKAHRRGALSDETAAALYAHPEIAAYL